MKLKILWIWWSINSGIIYGGAVPPTTSPQIQHLEIGMDQAWTEAFTDMNTAKRNFKGSWHTNFNV